MPAILDAATLLLPSAATTGNITGVPLRLYPRQLPTSAWVISVTVAPSTSCLFSLAVASAEAGPFTSINTITWPASQVGSKQIALGVTGHMAATANNTALWVRCSIATAGTVTASSWLTKPSDGSFGLASRSYALDGLGQL
jgi:hypothetical protein